MVERAELIDNLLVFAFWAWTAAMVAYGYWCRKTETPRRQWKDW
jgi:hypothetical protein